jgi:hypothetical protein
MAASARARLTASVVPFPQVRRRRFIAKTAARLAPLSPRTADRILAATLNQQTTTMARKGISAELVDRERHALETAIRAELWRAALTPDGRA